MGSLYINDFTEYSSTFHVVVQADTAFRTMISDMNKYYVRNQAGTMVPLGTVISYKPVDAAPLISHFNIFRTAEVDGSSSSGYSNTETLDALQQVAANVLPEGYNLEFSGLSYEEVKAGSSTIYIFMFSITFVFLFLAALYESWSVPFSVLLAVPIGAFGAILALFLVPSLTDNVYAQIGLITLIGLAAKNAILIVEFAKVRVDRGEDLLKSTLSCCKPSLATHYHDIACIYFRRFAARACNRCRRCSPQNHWVYGAWRYACSINDCHFYCAGFVCNHYTFFLW